MTAKFRVSTFTRCGDIAREVKGGATLCPPELHGCRRPPAPAWLNHLDSGSSGLVNILKEKRVISVLAVVFAYLPLNDMLVLLGQ